MTGVGVADGQADPGTTVEIALDDLATGTAMLVEVAGRRVCVARTDEDEVYAVDDTCTHEEESLSEGWLDGACIECPAHNSIFDLRTGEAVSLPADEPVRTHPVEVDGDTVRVTVAD